ncbi:hypothetical protein HNQ08_004983 [Deinococcus humi]|uniref:Uncharacterized protein n=1 Tax=Deinococcus humi TaxID=662880 RepID=A0A7W8JZ13_9DEIO|nr:hypothetical protein [Deinococcus humi]GGO38923.1 hypothetical protein GCM10008949_46250 [Deinococcus humi]
MNIHQQAAWAWTVSLWLSHSHSQEKGPKTKLARVLAQALGSSALITVFQSQSQPSRRAAAGTVQAHLGWTYAVALQLSNPGYDHRVWSERRLRPVEGHA